MPLTLNKSDVDFVDDTTDMVAKTAITSQYSLADLCTSGDRSEQAAISHSESRARKIDGKWHHLSTNVSGKVSHAVFARPVSSDDGGTIVVAQPSHDDPRQRTGISVTFEEPDTINVTSNSVFKDDPVLKGVLNGSVDDTCQITPRTAIKTVTIGDQEYEVKATVSGEITYSASGIPTVGRVYA